MKKQIVTLFLLVSLFFVGKSQSFVHPGAMNTKKDLDFMKAKVDAKQQPWKNAYDKLLSSKAAPYQGITPKAYSSLSYVPHPRASVDCGSYNKPNNGCNDMVYDGMAAYSLALRFYITENKDYATKAISIMMAWSDKYRKNTESNARLIVCWATPWYVNAAEILRYTPGSGWNDTNTNKFNTMLNRFKNYIFWETRPPNNWMMSSVEARIAIAIFQDDRKAFDNAIGKWKQRVKTYIYLKSDGSRPVTPAGQTVARTKSDWHDGKNRSGTAYVDGLTMETCRDISHTKLGVNSLANGAEMAWSQGEDLFKLEKTRLSAFLKLHAPWMMKTKAVPKSICDGKLDIVSESAFEILYNHLHDRLDVDLPNTKKMLDRKRPGSASRWVTKWETLCYAGRPFGPTKDCNNVNNGSATIDECGVCSGGTTGKVPNATCSDCYGTPNGSAKIDGCGICSGGTTGELVNGCNECFTVRSSSDDGNVAANTMDNNINTRWSAEGVGQFIEYCLGDVKTLESVSLSFAKGDERKATFDVLSSLDGITYTTLLSNQVSSGSTLEEETYVLNNTPVWKLRIVGKGNTSNKWNSVTQVSWKEATTVSTSDYTYSNYLNAYPNPSQSGIFNLSRTVDFDIYSSDGILIKSGSGKEVNLSTTKRGVYVLKAENKVLQLIH